MVGELEGIDFNAFFDPKKFSHKNPHIESYVEQKYTKTTKMRDKTFIFPTKESNLIYIIFFNYYLLKI